MRSVSTIVGLLVLAALVWNASELHYQSCVEVAKTTPDTASSVVKRLQAFNGIDSHAKVIWTEVDRCSRFPW